MLLKLVAKLGLFTILSTNLLFASILDERQALETSGISLKDLKICHQNAWKNLSIFIEYQVEPNKDDLNPKCLKNYVKNFLIQYKNSEDFWEIMNSCIVKWIVKDFPDIETIKSTFLILLENHLDIEYVNLLIELLNIFIKKNIIEILMLMIF